jgi:flagellar M-ring protein FliF
MDFLNKTFAQASELFRALTPAARITTGLLVVGIALSLAFLFRFGSSPADYYLFGGRILTDREIGQLQAAFSQAQLNDWDTTGNRIRVPHAKRSEYIAAAADANSLPHDFDTILEEMIASSSAFEPKEMREMKVLFAKQRQLSMIVQAMKGIEEATVKINEERMGGLTRQLKKSAVVAARAPGNLRLSKEQVEAIRHTVANGAGAAPADVVVSDLNGPTYPGRNADGSPSATDNVYTANKQSMEAYYQEKIADALAMIPGVIVGVSVELDPRLTQTTQTQTYNQPQPVRSANTVSKSTTRSDAGGGRTGAVPNGAIANRAEEVAAAAASSSGTESITNEQSEESESVVGSEFTRTQTLGLVEKTVHATISIPQSYFRQIWLEQQPPSAQPGGTPAEPDRAELLRIETEEMKRIEESIQRLIPVVSGGKDPWPRVYLRSYVDVKAPPPVPPTFMETLTEWLSRNWKSLGLGILALVGLGMVRSLAKSARPTAAAPAASSMPRPTVEPTRSEDATKTQATGPAQRVLKRKVTANGPNLREELAELVREDPDAAATIISNWIGDAV